jgi:glycosyltransferase involved in cell wall biosynthesis
MSKISAVIITFNEAGYIANCIKSISEVADEIVVVDSFSTDCTKEICLSLGVRFIENEFRGYRDQKNFAVSQASYDYILSLDADEELSPRLERSILSVKNDMRYDGYKFDRLNNFCGKWIHFTSLSPERKVRLFNRKKGKWGGLNIHEYIQMDDPRNVKRLKGDLIHWLYRSYEESIDKMNRYTSLLACEYYSLGIKASPKRLFLNPLWRFFHSFFLKVGFLDGYHGFVVSRYLAFTCYLKYVKLKKLYIDAKNAKMNHSPVLLTGSEINCRPVTIGFDAKRAFYNHSGLGNYSRNLLHALAQNNPGNSYFLLTPSTRDRYVVEDEEKFKLIKPVSLYRFLSSLWRLTFMKNDIKKHKIEIFHGLSQELPFGIRKTGAKSVVTVHDLIFMRFPEFYNWIDGKIYYWKLWHACKAADHIVAISEQTKTDIIRFLHVAPSKISVIHQGCNPIFWKEYSREFFHEIKAKYNLPEKYLLYLGTIEERKNLMGIIKAMHKKNIKFPLVAIGRKTEPYFNHIKDYISENNLTDIYFPDRVLTNELPAIYQNAECFIYPSLFEGFGIPLLEALVSKIPVITSKKGCFAEAAGPGSIYIDPYDPEMIGEAILHVINNKDVKENMIVVGYDFANNFREDVIAETYMKLYCSLLNT